MSNQPIVYPIFNPANWSSGDQALTVSEAESLFFSLSGGQVTGNVAVVGSETVSGTIAGRSYEPGINWTVGGTLVAPSLNFIAVTATSTFTLPGSPPDGSIVQMTDITGCFNSQVVTIVSSTASIVIPPTVGSVGVPYTLTSAYGSYPFVYSASAATWTLVSGSGSGSTANLQTVFNVAPTANPSISVGSNQFTLRAASDTAGTLVVQSSTGAASLTVRGNGTSTQTGIATVGGISSGGTVAANAVTSVTSVGAASAAISATTPSTSTTTGALTVVGGVGIGGQLTAAAIVLVDNELNLSTPGATTALIAGRQYSINITAATNTLTLPVGAPSGVSILVVDENNAFQTYPVTVDAGVGATISGADAGGTRYYVMKANYGSYTFNWTDYNSTWIVSNNISSAYPPVVPASSSFYCGTNYPSTTATNCTGFGNGVSNVAASGANNVFIGDNVAQSATTAARNVVVGSGSGWQLTSGVENMFIGSGCGSISTAQRNVGLGAYCLSATNGDSNLALGWAAMYGGGSTYANAYNVAIGSNAMRVVAGCSLNTCIGFQAGYPYGSGGISTGNSNTFIGANAGQSIVTGGNNVAIGAGSGWTSDVNNSTTIGNSSTLYAQLFGSLSMTPRMNTGYQLGYTLSTVSGGAPATNVPNGNYLFWSSNNSTGAVGDTFLLTFTGLPAGNYLSTVVAMAYQNAGIWSMEVSTNGGAYSTLYYAIDGYLSASTNPLSCPYFVQHLGGNLVIRLKCTGKNASSPVWRILICHWQATPTALTAITANQWATQGNQTAASINNYSVANGGIAFGGVSGTTGASMYGWGGLPNFQNFTCPTFYNVIY